MTNVFVTSLLLLMLFSVMKFMMSIKQVLLLLLSLELMNISLFIQGIFCGHLSSIGSIMFLLLVLAACEASLGLCLLIRSSRIIGSDSVSV